MKSLILYYSYRGNTQRIAERVHSAIGGDIARIDTVVPYTGSYDDVVAQGEQEVKRGFLPALQPMDIDLGHYDTIVLGTPVWWYTCAPAMRAFLTAHDLSGKTVYHHTGAGLFTLFRLIQEKFTFHHLDLKSASCCMMTVT